MTLQEKACDVVMVEPIYMRFSFSPTSEGLAVLLTYISEVTGISKENLVFKILQDGEHLTIHHSNWLKTLKTCDKFIVEEKSSK
jgi:hypothetical protein